MPDPAPAQPQSTLIVPPSIARLRSPVGVHRRGMKILVFGESKSGKGIRPNEKVLTPHGLVEIQDLEMWDEVIGSDGLPTKVLCVNRRGYQPNYRVTFDDGVSIITDGEHLWRVSNRKGQSLLLSSEDLFTRQPQNKGGESFYIPMVKWEGMDNDLPIDPYILGVLIGDGCFRGSTPTFTSIDPLVIEEISKRTSGQVNEIKEGLQFSISYPGQTTNNLKEALINLGLWGKYSYEKFIPLVYLEALYEDRVKLLQGLMDSDGYNDGKQLKYVTTSSLLINDIRQLVWSLGGSTKKITSKTTTYSNKGVEKQGREAYMTSLRMPLEMEVFKGERRYKYEARNRIREPKRRIIHVNRVEDAETVCITVKNPDGLFVTRDFIVTHNSFFLAHMPHPIFAIDAGEGGIQEYLDASKGDQCFESTTPEHFIKLCEFVLSHQDDFASIAIDPVTATWDDWMDFWSEKFGGTITGPQWNQVKGPWKVTQQRLKRSKLNVGQAAWLKDILYEKEERAPGVEGKLNIRPVEVPQVERKTPYHVDILLQTSIVRDSKNRPTSRHKITLAGGRRPRSVPPDEFFAGKNWIFDAKNPKDPWKTIVTPIAEKWDDGAIDYLGLDQATAEKEEKDLDRMTQDYTVGEIIRVIAEQTDLQVYRDRTWPNSIGPVVDELDEEHKAIVMEAHEKKKKELSK